MSFNKAGWYYQLESGRFLSADTIVPEPLRSVGWNGYGYSYNNPIRYSDPGGKNPLCFALALADGPAPFGDAACVVLLAYILYVGVTLAQNTDIPSNLSPPVEPLPPSELGPCPDQAHIPGPTLGEIDVIFRPIIAYEFSPKVCQAIFTQSVPAFATSYVPCGVYTKSISAVILRCVNFLSISNGYHPFSFLFWSLARVLNMSHHFFYSYKHPPSLFSNQLQEVSYNA
ncbi:MAG: hypothetical protein D6732_29010 [Methanobacteriota archaeon]|nr:MAG: hypothetical protein D6732_29010 [Euryarchaeota archaeon]